MYITISTAGGWGKRSLPHCCWYVHTATLQHIWAVFSKAKQWNPTVMLSYWLNCFENLSQIQTRMEFCTAALFIKAKILKKPGYPSTYECICKVGYIHVKVSRICHPKICLSGMRIIQSIEKKKKEESQKTKKWLLFYEGHLQKTNLHI